MEIKGKRESIFFQRHAVSKIYVVVVVVVLNLLIDCHILSFTPQIPFSRQIQREKKTSQICGNISN